MYQDRLISNTAPAAIIALLLVVLAGCGASSYNSGTTTGGGSPPGAYAEFLYVGDNGGEIHALGVDSNSGALTAVSGGPFSITNMSAASDVRLAADPSGMAVYATSAGIGQQFIERFLHEGIETFGGFVQNQ